MPFVAGLLIQCGTQNKTETEEQQKLEARNTEQSMLKEDSGAYVYPSDASVCPMHEHQEEARAPLMRVTSKVRLDQAKWSSNARTLRVIMRETSEL